MKEENINNLIEKYRSGTTSLEEEQFLLENVNKLDAAIEASSVFIKMNKKEIPDNFNDKLWDSFEPKIKTKHKYSYKIFGAVASVAIFVTLAFYTFSNNEQSIEEKEFLLNEAKNMFVNNENIIFEDELIIVYTKQE